MLDRRIDDTTDPEWTQIDCGQYHTVGLTKKGEVFTWGSNDIGQLGHGGRKSRIVPTKVAGLDGLVITQISCGANHTAALTDKGEVFTWCVQLRIRFVLVRFSIILKNPLRNYFRNNQQGLWLEWTIRTQ